MNCKTILIVDDEKDVLLVTEKRLTLAGYRVITADNGAEALLAAKSQRPDLIVLDVQMPGMDGGEIGYKLKENPITQNIPVVYSTCLISESESYGCSDKVMLAKSKDSKELIDVINKILQGTEKESKKNRILN